MNRRTADVVSRGFSNLFVLQKNDLEMVLKDYEDAKRILNTRARKLMKENEERVAMEFKEHQKYLLEQELKGRQPITDVSTFRYIFRQIKSFLRFRLAFVFGLQTYYLIDFSKIYQSKGLEPKKKG